MTELRMILVLLVMLGCASAQQLGLPVGRKTDYWCRDIPLPPGVIPNPFPVGSDENPLCYMPRDVEPPELLDHPEPIYTGAAFLPYGKPTVVLAVFVGTQGQPLRILMARGFGMGIDELAMDTVKAWWRWKPATKDGQPVAVLTSVQVTVGVQGTSVNPYLDAPPRETPLREVDGDRYPLTVYLVGIGVGMTSTGYIVSMDATFVPYSTKAVFRLRCTGKNRGCSIPRSASYPARWLIPEHAIEIVGMTDNQEWRTVEYEYGVKEVDLPAPLTYPWSLF